MIRWKAQRDGLLELVRILWVVSVGKERKGGGLDELSAFSLPPFTFNSLLPSDFLATFSAISSSASMALPLLLLKEVLSQILYFVFTPSFPLLDTIPPTLQPPFLTPSPGTSHLFLVSKNIRRLSMPLYYHSITIANERDWEKFLRPQGGLLAGGGKLKEFRRSLVREVRLNVNEQARIPYDLDFLGQVLTGQMQSDRVLVELEEVVFPNLKRLSFFDAELDEEGELFLLGPPKERVPPREFKEDRLDEVLEHWEALLLARERLEYVEEGGSRTRDQVGRRRRDGRFVVEDSDEDEDWQNCLDWVVQNRYEELYKDKEEAEQYQAFWKLDVHQRARIARDSLTIPLFARANNPPTYSVDMDLDASRDVFDLTRFYGQQMDALDSLPPATSFTILPPSGLDLRIMDDLECAVELISELPQSIGFIFEGFNGGGTLRFAANSAEAFAWGDGWRERWVGGEIEGVISRRKPFKGEFVRWGSWFLLPRRK